MQGPGFATQFGYFILKQQLFTLEFGHFDFVGGWADELFFNFTIEGAVTTFQLVEMILQ